MVKIPSAVYESVSLISPFCEICAITLERVNLKAHVTVRDVADDGQLFS